ncbi:MAG TPA: PhzF family phenazine biosynthesis protein, partial [Prolixibacteraceae bacterium]|nr:PhzF family phenazine biosynthesis protein [Prolixibacteraceae bacterium]
RKRAGKIVLNFPASELEEIPFPKNIEKAFGKVPEKCIRGKEDLMLVFDSENKIKNLQPNFDYLKTLDARGIIATAKSVTFDFVSRFFAPVEGINEDPVTGSAHTVLIPYWAKELGKPELSAKQISLRSGLLQCKYLNNRVEIGGKAVTYLTGTIKL